MICAWRFRALAGIALVCAGVTTRPALASWGPDPVTVKATTARIPQVASCSDGGFGTLVAWQEESSPGQGVLLVQHLLADGTVDPNWPASGAVASSELQTRTYVQAIADDLGGMFLLWTSPSGALLLTRITSSGSRGGGWLDPGEFVADLSPGARPRAVSDGAHGLLLAFGDATNCEVIHVGPDTTQQDWLAWSVRPFGTLGPDDRVLWPCVASSPDGSFLLACAFAHLNGATAPGDWRIIRLTTDGLRAPGWPVGGRSFGTIDLTGLAGTDPAYLNAALIDICPDGESGVFAHVGVPTYNGGSVSVEPQVHRLTSSGLNYPGWPAAGWSPIGGPILYELTRYADGSLRAISAGPGKAVVAYNLLASEGGYDMELLGCQDFACVGLGSVYALGYEMIPGPTVPPGSSASVWAAFFSPDGPRNIYDIDAFLGGLLFPPGVGWYERHNEPFVDWFGDVSIAPASGGGSVLFWSQVNVLHGLFARRLGPGGQNTGVAPPPAAALSLREVRFVRGHGVRARMSVPMGATATLTLYDIAGRRRVEETLQGGIDREVTLAGTASLPAGVYFVAARAGGDRASDRVVVLP
jgi:hypothetical protein